MNLDDKHAYRVGSHSESWSDLPADDDTLDKFIASARKRIEPWLSAVFQAEHLNLLIGSGFTTAVRITALVKYPMAACSSPLALTCRKIVSR